MKHEQLKGQLIKTLVDFFDTDYRRITHAIEVLKQAELLIGHYDHVDEELLLASAVLHDVGIKPSEAELGLQRRQNPGTIRPSRGYGAARENRL